MGQEDRTTDISHEMTDMAPVLPLRDVVVYPHMVIPLFVGREKSIAALEEAMRNDKYVLLAAQRQAATMLHHDIKARCLTARVLGARSAMLGYLVLPDGRTTSEATDAEFLQQVPALLAGQPSIIMLPSGA